MMGTQCSKHVEEYNKLIIKQEFVHLVGQLLRYSDAQLKKHQNSLVTEVVISNIFVTKLRICTH